MSVRGLRFDRQRDGGYVVYQYGKRLGEILPDGRRSPSHDPKALKAAAQELDRRGLLYAYASRRSRTTRRAGPRRNPRTGRFTRAR